MKIHHYLVIAILFMPLSGWTETSRLSFTADAPVLSMSTKKEVKLGKEMHEEILKSMPIYRDPDLQAYVNDIGQKVAAHAKRKKIEYTFTIIDSPDINAFAVPGGYIYINRGLLTYLNSEAQLAAVLGHEVGHIAAKHASEQKSMNTAKNLLSGIIAIGTQITFGAGGNELGELTNIAGSAIVSGYGREHELEADRLGAEYLYKSNYDPGAMEEVIGVLKDKEQFSRLKAKAEGKKPRSYHGLFASHPRNDKRLREVISAAGELPKSDAITNHDIFRQKTAGLEFGDSSKEGVRKGSRYYHKLLDFTLAFPGSWKVQNSPNVVVGFPTRQDAFIQLQVKGTIGEVTPEQFIREGMEIDDLTEGEAISQYGLEGYTGIVPQSEKRGPVRVAVIFHRNNAFYFTGVNRKPNAALNYDPFFMAAISSFRPMKGEDYRNAAKLKLKYVRLEGPVSYEALARGSKIAEYPEQELRLLNGDYPNKQPVTGDWIKVVD